MTARFAWVGAEIIEVSVRSWLMLWVIVTAIWACVFSQDMFVDTWIFIAFFYFFLITAIPVVARQYWLYTMVIPVHYPLALSHHHTFPCGARKKSLASAGAQAGEGHYSKLEDAHAHGAAAREEGPFFISFVCSSILLFAHSSILCLLTIQPPRTAARILANA
jgi:hypothetical protein